RHRLQELPCDPCVPLDKGPELPGREAVAAELAVGRNGRACGPPLDQRDLAEVVAGPKLVALAAADRDGRFAAFDHEEAGARLSLVDDRGAGLERALLERPGEALELAGLEVGEERDALEELDWCFGHARILRLCRFRATREFLDLALGGLQSPAAEAVQLLAALPELERLVERRLAAFQPVDDRLQLLLGLLERHVRSSTRAPKLPSATSTSTGSPGWTACGERTVSSPARTMAYPRSSVERGDRARSRPPACSSFARRRSSSSRGARARRSCVPSRRRRSRSRLRRVPRSSPARARPGPPRRRGG